MYNPNRSYKALAIISLFVAAIIGLSVFSLLQHRGQVSVKVVILPPDATLTIDGQPAKTGTIYFTKTTHTLKVSRQYFTTVTKTINFATYDASQTLYMIPSADSDQARQYLVNHPDIAAQFEIAGGVEASYAQQQLSQNKLIHLLPYTGPGHTYTVDYGSETQADGTQKVTIYILANTDQAKQDARDWLQDQGFDPKKLTIVYRGLDGKAQPTAGGSGGSEYQ